MKFTKLSILQFAFVYMTAAWFAGIVPPTAAMAEDNFIDSPKSTWDFTIEVAVADLEIKPRGFEAKGASFIISHHGPESADWVRDWGIYSVRVLGRGGKKSRARYNDCLAKAQYAKANNMILQLFAYGFKERQLHVAEGKRFRTQKQAIEADLGRKLNRIERRDLWENIRATEELRSTVRVRTRRNQVECAVFYWNADGTATFVDDSEINAAN